MQPINRTSKRFLNFLLTSSPDFDGQVYTYEFIENNYDQPIERVSATIRFLKQRRYLDSAISNGNNLGIVLTEQALSFSHPAFFSGSSFSIASLALSTSTLPFTTRRLSLSKCFRFSTVSLINLFCSSLMFPLPFLSFFSFSSILLLQIRLLLQWKIRKKRLFLMS